MHTPSATILIVDDEPRNRKLLETMLRRDGYETVAAANGEQALVAIAQRAPDLILLDIKLPGIDGYQVARALKDDPGTSNIPIIMVTVLIDRDARMAALQAGAEEFVTKPIDPNELSLRVRNLLRMKAHSVLLENHSQMLEQRVLARTADLLESEQRLRTIFETDPECVKVVTGNMVLLDMNPAGLAMLEADSLAEAQARPLIEFIVPEYRAAFADLHARVMRGESGILEFEAIGLKGARRWLETHAAPLGGRNGKTASLLGVTRDITVRKAAQTRIVRLNRVYAVLSGINSAIVRIRKRDELFNEVCRIALSEGGFILARVIEFDSNGHAGIAASTETDTRLFQKIVDEYNADPEGSGSMLGLALRGRQPLFSNDVAIDARIPNRAALTKEGTYSLALLPLFVGKRLAATVILRAQEAGAFNTDENRLLLELAANISLALEHIEQEERLETISSERDHDARQLRESERRFSDLLRNVQLVSVMLDREARITYCNEYLLQLTGWRLEEVIGQSWVELFIPPESGNLKDRLAALLADGPQARHGENRILTRSGERRLIRWNNSVLRSAAGDVIGTASIGEDITEQKLAEIRIRRLNRVYAVLSGINTLIVRVTDREELFREACRIAVEHGGFRMAWIGLIERDRMELLPVASAGTTPDFRALVNQRFSLLEDAPRGNILAARAIRDKVASVSNDVRTDPSVVFKDEHEARGSRSMVIFPLNVHGEVVGLLTLYSDEVGFFDDEEMKLLTELAGDVAFAVDHIERAAKLARMTRVNAVLSDINALIVRARDRDELFSESCRIAVDAGAFSKVWIGTMEPESRRFRIAAAHGGDPLFFKALEAELVTKVLAGEGLVARAVTMLQPVVSNEAASDPEMLLKDDLTASDVRSAAVFPLVVAGAAVGVLVLNSDVQGFFDDEEMVLLAELARNIAFAVDHIGQQDRLDYFAFYDALTGLANRTLFLERLAQYMRSAIAGGHKLALFYVDLERFRNINDSLGRPAGDAILKQVAEWLIRNVGDAGLLARVSGDQFAIVLPEVKQEGDVARLLDKRIRAFHDHQFRVDATEIRLTTRAGVALFPNDGTDAATLLGNAEAALKNAKARGDRLLFYTQKMTDAVAGKLTLENQLRRALDNEEFVLHYQPKVSLASGKLTSAEALIRWNDPQTGLVPPGKFIPILEETGLIYDVGRWALRKAIEDYLRWRAAGLPAVRIAVNVSPLQLRNRGFVDEIRLKVGIDPAAAAGLELEITESLIMEDVKHNIGSLHAIRAMGVSIAIDDFGTGFSSLSYLSKLPVDSLKIDRSFIIDMTSDAPGLSLVSTIINLAHALKLKVVAEGVETEEQSRLLRLLRCDEMQGFLFSKPVPAEVFEASFLALPILADAT